jgi:3-phenylpropionate/trans-cinnamate dioxygenase ferredoxin reductase subunit
VELDGVLDLRTKEDADLIRGRISPGSKAVIVGMGFIGAEVAASLRRKGVDVAVVEVFKVPLYKALGEDIGRVFESIHRDEGVVMHFEEGVSAFRGDGRVEVVVTKKGITIECDFAIVGVGVEPVTDLAEGTGIAVENGVVVDEHCRTNVEGVFAAGDVTNHYHPVFDSRMRVEHWQNAIKQGTSAAKNMLGQNEPYDETHWFWSDQYDYNLQYAGFSEGSDQTVMRGSLHDRDFCLFFLKDRRLVGAVGLGRGKLVRQSMRLIKERTIVDPSKLGDEDVDLKSLRSHA